MIKHLTTHGNSAALIFEKPIMELLGIDKNTPLQISTDGKSLIISPIKNIAREKKFRAALKKVNVKHGKTLAKLA